MAQSIKEEFEQEVQELVKEIFEVFERRYPKGTKEYKLHMLSALASIAANILANLNDPKMEKMLFEQIQSHTRWIKESRKNGEGQPTQTEIPNIN
jgi:hypothetical protein